MGNQSAGIIVVSMANLPKTPMAFREYVRDYFVEETVLGTPCMVAHQALFMRHEKKTGVAPCHSVDLMRYREGLGEESLSSWIERANKEGILWKRYNEWDDGSSISYDFD